MKYQVGDVFLVRDILLRPHLPLHPPLRLPIHPLLRLCRPHHHLKNTFGIITEAKKHTDLYEEDSTENDNAYIWYSQVDNKEYYFYQDEVDGEVIK